MNESQLNTAIGENIKNLRKTHGLSMEKLAKKMGLTIAAVSLIEQGARGTTVFRLLKLSHIFNQPVDFFFSRKADDETKESASHRQIDLLLSSLTEAELDFAIMFVELMPRQKTKNKLPASIAAE